MIPFNCGTFSVGSMDSINTDGKNCTPHLRVQNEQSIVALADPQCDTLIIIFIWDKLETYVS